MMDFWGVNVLVTFLSFLMASEAFTGCCCFQGHSDSWKVGVNACDKNKADRISADAFPFQELRGSMCQHLHRQLLTGSSAFLPQFSVLSPNSPNHRELRWLLHCCIAACYWWQCLRGEQSASYCFDPMIAWLKRRNVICSKFNQWV